MPNDYLVIVFTSNRPCSGCMSGNYHVWLAQSDSPFYGFDFPLFQTPAVLRYGGSAVAVQARSPISAGWIENQLQIFVRTLSGIKGYSLPDSYIAGGNALTEDPLANSTRANDRLLYVNTKTFSLLSQNGGNAYEATIVMPATGNTLANARLATADAIAPVSAAVNGVADSYLIAQGGRLYTGTPSQDWGEHDAFNAALEGSGLYLGAVGIVQSYLGINDMIVFSAGESASAQQDLYLVTSHNTLLLWLLVGIYGDAPANPGPYRIFVTQATTDGNIGGILAADYMCAVDTGNPDPLLPFKAMLVDGTNRVASLSPDAGDGQTNWVLVPGETYISTSGGATIATANAAGLFSFNLSSAIYPGTLNVWTGLSGDWTTNNNTCSGWTSNAVTGNTGTANSTTNTAIAGTPSACSGIYRLYCVEQPNF